jgi:hypothetical protein
VTTVLYKGSSTTTESCAQRGSAFKGQVIPVDDKRLLQHIFRVKKSRESTVIAIKPVVVTFSNGCRLVSRPLSDIAEALLPGSYIPR